MVTDRGPWQRFSGAPEVCYGAPVKGTRKGDWAALLGGSGERSWTAIAEARGPRSPGAAWGVPARAVRRRMCLDLPVDPEAARAEAAAFLAAIDDALKAGWGVAGYVGYEAGAALEGVIRPATDRPEPAAADLVVFAPDALQLVALPASPSGPRGFETAPPPHEAPAAHIEAPVRPALRGIRRGSIYQVNITERATVELAPHAGRAGLADLLAGVLAAQPVPYGMAMQGRDGRLISGSMERFVHVVDGDVRSRPIKGTRPRGRDEAADRGQRDDLRASPKERAENTMIVDMVRNDLSRVCVPGSVVVPALLEAVAYRTLWHLESEVRGRLLPGVGAAELLAATMPPASVTGCPKVSAMRWIARLERRPRGPYCGALGMALPGGVHDWSVGIRTAWLGRGATWIDVGAGIVAASDPAAEFAEIRTKARAATAALRALKHLTPPAAGRHVERRSPVGSTP